MMMQVIDGVPKTRLLTWLTAPAGPFYVMHIAGRFKALLNAANFDGRFSVAQQPNGISIGLTATFQTPERNVILSQ